MVKTSIEIQSLVLLALGLSACTLWSVAEPVPQDAPQLSSKMFFASPLAASFGDAATAAAQQLALSRAQQQQWPGMTAAVAWRGQLLWAGAVGYADLAAQQPVTIESQFRLGIYPPKP